ncbi:hypothetical protein HDU76_000429 [Blyttiomyces sp. JEL0837]|nr:hypothetical protein HDU76_000429 [Blyttiomyces sp. JEL0837]
MVKPLKVRDDHPRELSHPECAICSYGLNNVEHKFYAAAYADSGKLIESVEEFIAVVGHGWYGHRLCCDFDEPQEVHNVTNHFGHVRRVRLSNEKAVVSGYNTEASSRRRRRDNSTSGSSLAEFIQQPPTCLPLLSVNPLFNPYNDILTPAGSATRSLLAFPYFVQTGVSCSSHGVANGACTVTLNQAFTTTTSLSYSISDSQSNSLTNSIGTSHTVGESSEAMTSVSDTLEHSNTFTHTSSQGGSQSNTWSEALTKTSESQTNWQKTHSKDQQKSVNVGHDVNYQQSHSQESGTSSSDTDGWDTKASLSGTVSATENFLVGSATESFTASAEVGASGSHTDGSSHSVTDSSSSGRSDNLNVGRQLGSSDSSTRGGSRSDSISDAVTNSATSETNWQTSDSYASGNSQSHTVGSSNTYGTSKSLTNELQKSYQTAQSIDTSHSTSNETSTTFSISIQAPLGDKATVNVAYLAQADFQQVPFICKQNGQNVIMKADIADLSRSNTSSTALVLLDADAKYSYSQLNDNDLTTATAANSFTSDNIILVNQQTTGGSDITGGKMLIMSTANYEVWLTGFGSMYVKQKDINGRIGQKLWHTHTNVQRTTDTKVNNVLYNKGSTRLLIDDMGHILIQVDNMFNNIGVTPYNYTYDDSDTRETITDTFVTVWSNVPKHMMFQVGIKGKGYTLVLEEFPSNLNTAQNWNLVLYDGGGSKVWCATSAKCNWAGSTGYRFPRNYLLPTDYPTDAVEKSQDGPTYPHNYLNPAYNLTVVKPSVHISENQRCGPILSSGQGLTSPNGRFKLILDWSGNLIFKDGVRTMWETYSANLSFAQPPYTLALSNRGSLYVSDKLGGLIVNSVLENNIPRNSNLNITDQGELQVFGTDGRQIWTSFDLLNPGLSGWRTWNERKTFCYARCSTCLPKQPPSFNMLYSNGSDFTPWTAYLKAGQTLPPVSGNDSLVVTNTSVSIGNCSLFQTDSSKLVQGMILTISGTGRLSYIDVNSTVALWQIGTFYTGVEPFTVSVEDSVLTIRDSTGVVTTKYSTCASVPTPITPVPISTGHVVIPKTDISGFVISNATLPFKTFQDCSKACEANPKCDWWNANPDLGCFLKQTNKSQSNVYTWFMNTNGSIAGDIPQYDMASNLQPTQDLFPQDCYNKCAATPGCHWVNFHYTKYNGKVACSLKQAPDAVNGTTGIPRSHGPETSCSGNAQYRALPGVDVSKVGDIAIVDNVISACECAKQCEGNSTCDFYSYGDNKCYLKQTTRQSGIYTWFIHSNGPLVGDIPGFDMYSSALSSSSPQSCLSTCINTPNCHWVNFKYNADQSSVSCWPKQGNSTASRVLGYAGAGGYASFEGFDTLAMSYAVNGTVGISAGSVRECSRLCSADIRCGWSTFISANNTCYLNTPTTKTAVTTQFRESVNSIPGDIFGYDLSPTYKLSSSALCAAKCSSTPNCQWFNFYSTYANSNTIPSCYLKQGNVTAGHSIVYNFVDLLAASSV